MNIKNQLEIIRDVKELRKQAYVLSLGFGKSIREARKKKGLTLQEVADRMGLTKVYLSDVELCRRTITEENLRKLSKII